MEKKSPHKSGFNDEGYHDSAIVFCGGKDDKKPYIITILTEPLNGRHSINSDSANFTKYAKFADKVIDSFESYKEANPNKFDTREIESEM